MTEGTQALILRRMAGLQDGGDRKNPLTASRALRLVLAKVAQDQANLPLSVSSVAATVDPLDPALADLPDDLMLVRLDRGERTLGLVGLDPELRAGILEVATIGTLHRHPADPRAATGTDHFMCQPLLAALFARFPEAVQGTALEGWVDGATVGATFADKRRAALVLDEGIYRIVQMTVQLGQTDRQGLLVMMLPMPTCAGEKTPDSGERRDWSAEFVACIEGAPAVLDAQLHRFTLPIATVRSLQVGAVLPLDGCTVSSVALRALDGRVVAKARLGQSGGKRAIRIEIPSAPELQTLSTTAAPLPQMVALADVAADLAATSADDFAFLGGAPDLN